MKGIRRRRFLEATVGSFLGATGVSSAQASDGARVTSEAPEATDWERERLEQVLSIYGSEIGAVHRVRPEDEGR